MKHATYRITFAALVWILGVAGLSYWYKKSMPDGFIRRDKDKSIGYLKTANLGIERRPGERLIWEIIAQSDQVYAGDAVRTSSKGEGAIYLDKSKTTLMLEPDSLIVLEESNNSFSVGLIEGGLAVKQETLPTLPKGKKADSEKSALKSLATLTGLAEKSEEPPPIAEAAPVIKAGKTVLAIDAEKKSTELNLSLTKEKEVAVTVTKGELAVKHDDKKITVKEGTAGEIKGGVLDKSEMIQIIEPTTNAVIDIGAKGEKQATFKWKKLEKPLPVTLKIGQSRNTLAPIATAPASADTLSAPIAAGSFFWQLASADPTTGKERAASPVYRNTAISLTPPELIAPRLYEKLTLADSGQKSITFSWSLPTYLSSAKIFIALDKTFKNVLESADFTTASTYNYILKQEGTYYWKVIGSSEATGQKLSSTVGTFTIDKQVELEPPKLLAPKNGSSFMLSQTNKSSMFLEWDPAPGAESYKISVEFNGKPLITDNKISDSPFRLKELKAGSYRFYVKTVGANERESKPSESFTFKLVDQIPINLSALSEKVEYESSDPSIPLNWEAKNPTIKRWKVVYHPAVAGGETQKAEKELKGTSSTLNLPRDGKYEYWIVGLDDEGRQVAQSPHRTVTVAPTPPISAPILKALALKNGVLEAAKDGSVDIKWDSVAGSSGYMLQFSRTDRKKTQTFKTVKTGMRIKDLLPGKYKFTITSLNKRGEGGTPSEEIIVNVPNDSNISAPQIKGLKIQ